MRGLSKTSLHRHLTSHMTNSSRDAVNTPFICQSKITHNKILTTEQETELKKYLIEASKLHYGLGIFEVKTLVSEYAKRNGISYPAGWDAKQQAGATWYYSFMARNLSFSLRTPEQTSLARATSFNRRTVSIFFDKLKGIMGKIQISVSEYLEYG